MPANPIGAPISSEAEDLFETVLQAAALADGAGTVAFIAGYAGPKLLELVNAGTGTCTVTIEGSFDGVTWYACGFQLIDNTAAPARSVTPIAVTAAPFSHVYAVLDAYPRLRARITATVGATGITATLRALPLS